MITRPRPQRSNPRSVPVQVRLSPEKYERYENTAKLGGLPLATYLRNRLENEDQVLDVLEGLHDILQEVERRLLFLEDKTERSPGGVDAVAIETLMLLRSLARGSGKRQDLEMIHGELRRQGFTPWKGER